MSLDSQYERFNIVITTYKESIQYDFQELFLSF